MLKKQIPGLKLLIFQQDGEYIAHMLDFDLAGTGKDRKEALNAVCETASAQIAFAIESGRTDELFHPAPAEYYEKWNRAGEKAIMEILISKKKAESDECEALELSPSSFSIPALA